MSFQEKVAALAEKLRGTMHILSDVDLPDDTDLSHLAYAVEQVDIQATLLASKEKELAVVAKADDASL